MCVHRCSSGQTCHSIARQSAAGQAQGRAGRAQLSVELSPAPSSFSPWLRPPAQSKILTVVGVAHPGVWSGRQARRRVEST